MDGSRLTCEYATVDQQEEKKRSEGTAKVMSIYWKRYYKILRINNIARLKQYGKRREQ